MNINNIYKLQAFSLAPGDFLFDTFQVLLHFCCSSIELQNGLIDHFFVCLAHGDVDALESYQYDLEPKSLCQEHKIHDVDTYFLRMQIFSFPIVVDIKQRLWGYSFCIQWLANWLNISVAVWFVKNKARCYLFKKYAKPNPYCILFHNTTSNRGHYEPLLYKKTPILNLDQPNHFLSHVCKDLQNYWNSIVH